MFFLLLGCWKKSILAWISFWGAGHKKTKSLTNNFIGTPLSNTKVYILDKEHNKVPIDVEGEIHISGIGLSRGYLKEKPLTLQKFIDIKINDNKIQRVYKTGDLGRYIDKHTICYTGRIEQQIKFKGMTINLGGIEAAFYQHPNLRSVVVSVCTAFEKEEIFAYFTEFTYTPLDELYDFLKLRLHASLLPSQLIRCDRFPLLPNGKIDREQMQSMTTSPTNDQVSIC